jgi:hypothetical protein
VGNELPFKPFFGIIFRGFFLLAKGRLDVNFGNLLALGHPNEDLLSAGLPIPLVFL